MNTLLLASKSPSRKFLLGQAQIPFVIIEQSADETACDWGLPLAKLVESIALHKMNHAVMPRGKEGQIAFALTADTLSQDKDGSINGKPTDRADAIEKIKRARNGSRLCTAFCLDQKIYRNGVWQIEKRIMQCIEAEYQFIIPDHWIETYLDKTMALSASNAIAVEDFGTQFLKMVHGSYSTIVGLPMFELREALEELNFF